MTNFRLPTSIDYQLTTKRHLTTMSTTNQIVTVLKLTNKLSDLINTPQTALALWIALGAILLVALLLP